MVETGTESSGNGGTAVGRTAAPPKGVLVALAIVYCLVGFVAGPLGVALVRVSYWLAYFCGGMLGAIPVLLAIWAALGPPPALQRIMWTSAAFVAAVYAFVIGISLQEGRHAPSEALPLTLGSLSLFLLFTLLLVPIRLIAGWQISHAIDESGGNPARANQFRVKDLMVAAAILAIALGVGRCFIGFDSPLFLRDWNDFLRDWNDAYRRMIEPFAIFALTLLPMAPIGGICLALQSGKKLLTCGLAVSWGIVNFAVVLLLTHNGPHGGTWSELVKLLCSQQAGCLIASFFSVMTISSAGYRWSTARENHPASSSAAIHRRFDATMLLKGGFSEQPQAVDSKQKRR